MKALLLELQQDFNQLMYTSTNGVISDQIKKACTVIQRELDSSFENPVSQQRLLLELRDQFESLKRQSSHQSTLMQSSRSSTCNEERLSSSSSGSSVTMRVLNLIQLCKRLNPQDRFATSSKLQFLKQQLGLTSPFQSSFESQQENVNILNTNQNPNQLLNELELHIQALCEAFEAKEQAREDMGHRTAQSLQLNC